MKIKPIACLCCVLGLFGCAQTRVITIVTKPADAIIRIDGVERGRAPIVDEQFVFHSQTEMHRIAASRLGFRDAAEVVTQDYVKKEILLELKPEMQRITIRVEPGPAIVRIDGQPLNDGQPTSFAQAEVDMSLDARNNPVKHTITAERPNFVSASREISRIDRDRAYELRIEPVRKILSITTKPPGAQVSLDDEPLGISPLQSKPMAFPVDLDTNDFIARKLRAEKPGFDPTELNIAWDGGRTNYQVDLTIKSKEARFFCEPAGATVTIDGKEIPRSAGGIPVASLQFPPLNDKGDLPTYSATISKMAADSEWEPQTITIAWDNAKTDYRVGLKEILTRPVAMLAPDVHRNEQGWEIIPERTTSIAMKDVAEPKLKSAPQLITKLAKDSQLGSMDISPDGSQIVFTVLSSTGRNDFKSQMFMIKTDGSGGAEIISDGKSLDMMPSFTPGGDQIVFSSNRAGKRMNIFRMSSNGAPGITRLTSNDTNDLWPTVDSDPQPRLFYQAMVDTRPDPRLYMTQIGTIFQTDLSSLGGKQPRISPKNDAIIFSAVNEATGKHDIYRMNDRGGAAENLTNTPDVDECDASWSNDGSKIVFASDRGADEEGRHNYDIWMMDLNKSTQPVQVTTNGSRDDSPSFDITGNNIFFRSNRGGEWGIWKISVK